MAADCRIFIFKVIEDGGNAESKFQLVGRTPLVLSTAFVSNESLEACELSWTGPLKAGRYLLMPSTTGCRMKKRKEQPESDVGLVSLYLKVDPHPPVPHYRVGQKSLSQVA